MTWRELRGGNKGRPRKPPLLIRLLESRDPAAVLGAVGEPGDNPDRRQWFTGGFPPACLSGDARSRQLWFTGYEQTYLERDLRDLSTVSDLGLFQRFIRLAALRTGHVLNVRELARDCGSNGVTISRWISLMETGCLLRRLPPYYSNRAKRLIKAPKLYLCDSGLACFLCGLPDSKSLVEGPFRGAMAETYAFQNIAALVAAFRLDASICHFRSHIGYEVDFIIEAARNVVAVEVKSSGRIDGRDLKGLEQFLQVEPRCRVGLVMYQGSEVVRLAERMWAVPSGLLIS
jgi:predicted AAA+ superfamily ATPase